MTIIYLIRHNEPDRGIEDDLSRPLTARGREQIADVTAYLKDKGVQAIYSSDCRRTLETISGFARYSGLEIHADVRLREGILGCPKEENPIHTQKQWEDFDYRLPAGESIHQVQARMCQCVEEILKRHVGQTIVICSHGTAMSTLINFYDSSFGWEQAKAVKRVWPWILRFEFDEDGRFIQYETMVQ